MKKNSFQIGVMAVDLVVDMLHRGERGLPARPSLLMVEGSWSEGATLLPRRRRPPAADSGPRPAAPPPQEQEQEQG